jgi:3'-phosphoadenosine 5'-phosphosulfate sulfotransferase (PAPS reductase)/FAD synthetase
MSIAYSKVVNNINIPRMLPIPEGMLPLASYDYVDICISGGRDSTAIILMMIYGYEVPREKIRLVHFRIDGPEENPVFFDWKETADHIAYIADFFDLRVETIWDELGLGTRIEQRGMFPDAKNRFCTSYGKRDCYGKYVRKRGSNVNVLVVSGERAEESSKRKTLPVYEVHFATAPTLHRRVDWFRPILHLTKSEVKDFCAESGIKEHPCYAKGFTRCSCKFCILSSRDEMKLVSRLPDPNVEEDFKRLKALESKIGHSMRFVKGQKMFLCEFVEEGIEEEETIQLC